MSLDNNQTNNQMPWEKNTKGETCIAILDVGKTNKKLMLFDEQYNMIYESSAKLDETTDEDGFACEDVTALTQWIKESVEQILLNNAFDIKAINFSGYGASLVHLDEQLNCCTPLYNYIKPYTKETHDKFYSIYGNEEDVAVETASPVLGNLNSGMQLYRLKQEQPQVFEKIKYALHLPQYCSFVITKKCCSDITSIGCHTMLWDFKKKHYHEWIYKEGIDKKLAPICKSDDVIDIALYDKNLIAGIGLHDSSSALIPYLSTYDEPFVLISTGTWNISLNPFNKAPLTKDELRQDCLCYLTHEGKPVKASRLFAGYEHEQAVKKLCSHFNKQLNYHASLQYNDELVLQLKERKESFDESNPDSYNNFEEAYHHLIMHIVEQQIAATNLVLEGSSVKKIFADGGFSRNNIFMQLLANTMSEYEVYAASVPQASAIGAALVIHHQWNKNPLPKHLVHLKKYSPHTLDISTNS